jgi:DnaK suppressor protein
LAVSFSVNGWSMKNCGCMKRSGEWSMANPINLQAVRRSQEAEHAMLQESMAEVTQALDAPEEHLADELDAAEASSERQLRSSLLAQSQRQLQQVEAALRRLEAGTYGLCERCGQAIRPERLSALPYATTCLNCQAHYEQASV